ncbi:hypothetical protein ACHQM5_024817 [Ranunculus cassubicifolius]
MSKVATLLLVVLLLVSPLCFANARPNPIHSGESSSSYIQDADVETENIDESCDGIAEDECLMRRTLAGRADYIYTQSHKP